jgi:hypothetical protein
MGQCRDTGQARGEWCVGAVGTKGVLGGGATVCAGLRLTSVCLCMFPAAPSLMVLAAFLITLAAGVWGL